MALNDTLARVDADLAAGRVPLARQRLRGLVSSFPDDLALRCRLAEVYRLYGDTAQAGRWMYLEEDRDPAETTAFEARYRTPLERMRALAWRGPEARVGSRFAAEQLAALRTACSEELGRPVDWGTLGTVGEDGADGPRHPVAGFLAGAGCFAAVAAVVGIWVNGLVALFDWPGSRTGPVPNRCRKAVQSPPIGLGTPVRAAPTVVPMRIRIVDAFTDRPFSGNPAGVLLLDTFPDDHWLQKVAAEVNLSETAFAHPLPEGGDADWALRWFTPVAEVDMCGHATLATAHVLHTTGRATGTVRFAARCGVLAATSAVDGTITMDFPTSSLTPVEAPDGLAEALGAEVVSVHDTAAHIGDLLVELRDEAAVRTLQPDPAALAGLSERGVIATAPAEDPSRGHDFVSRCFFPRYGIDEDPVTGSAHTALAPFWSARFGRAELTGLQGGARTGVVRTTLRGERTLLTGHAVTVMEGDLLA